ncbi:hypothetical protein [Paenibacillus kobensis]|uniref:hypothetical protein n=1 Tax=Paenibacillus kobensis TaxID=59841 RepID=UPI000FD9F119|nr:hypothetical protein [Paenibacillus kobensis]
MLTNVTLEKRWVDDYLDLLNYAKQIGDMEWQQEIVGTLGDAEQREKQSSRELRAEALWRQFDTVNATMLELYRQLREAGNANIAARINEEVWELKVRRIEISRQLNAR